MSDEHAPTSRQAPRRHAPVRTPLFTAIGLLGLLATACGGSEKPVSTPGPEVQEIHLQPVGSAGPDPFTTSTATGESAPAQPPLPNQSGQGIRTVNAATPGLYGGIQRLGSCDVEHQSSLLTADNAKANAFAEASGVAQDKIGDFLRDLTPVVLRADTRVTGHGFQDGRAGAFQAVLQAGTAVLVDGHGMPRVRCGSGHPLSPPRAPKGNPVIKGDPWNGYQANQVIVIEPTVQQLDHLVLVNLADNTWLERKTGDDGAQDTTPKGMPPYDPAETIPSGPLTSDGPAAPTGPGDPAEPAGPKPPSGQNRPVEPAQPARPQPKRPSAPPSDAPTPIPPDLPNGPAQDVPRDLPQDLPQDLPPDGTFDLPPDRYPAAPPGDPGLPTGPDGATPEQADPYGYDPSAPYDPYPLPDTPQSVGPAPSMESA
ncbi:DUF6777 domain-containing protein [Streptomyces sp. A1136]|uniref:DUF6777 domain-containing protein n=1 Tax=Streptomyces sp. A1136 TaxID=2563102 RepID=UPI0019D09193|nr:DUF6777 domain-containing protein [Streptomyces sp. A1136]